MKTNTKLYSVLAPAALILFLISVSSTASAAIAQSASHTITETSNSYATKTLTTCTKELSGEAEKEIDSKNVTDSNECTDMTSQTLPTSFLVKDSTNKKTVVTALRPKP